MQEKSRQLHTFNMYLYKSLYIQLTHRQYKPKLPTFFFFFLCIVLNSSLKYSVDVNEYDHEL